MTDIHRICASRGPRIGNSGAPRCAKVLGHSGLHRGFPGSGFEHEHWEDPVMRDEQFAGEYGGPMDIEDPLEVLL